MLTTKQEKFVRELIKGKTQRQAYIAAYPNSKKWKKESVDSKASVLLKNEKVSKRYEELKKRAEEKVVVDAAYVKQLIIDTELAILTADPYKFVNEKATREDFAKAIKNYKVDAQGRISYEFYDKQQAIEKLMILFDIGEKERETINVILGKAEGYDV